MSFPTLLSILAAGCAAWAVWLGHRSAPRALAALGLSVLLGPVAAVLAVLYSLPRSTPRFVTGCAVAAVGASLVASVGAGWNGRVAVLGAALVAVLLVGAVSTLHLRARRVDLRPG